MEAGVIEFIDNFGDMRLVARLDNEIHFYATRRQECEGALMMYFFDVSLRSSDHLRSKCQGAWNVA